VLLLLSGIGPGGYSWPRATSIDLSSASLLLATYLASNVLGPALLPWLPGRALSLKGVFLGGLLVLGMLSVAWLTPGLLDNWPTLMGWALAIPAVASFITMGFVGSTTYTSLSGVRREMRIAVPFQIAGVVGGLVAWIIGRFV
jgi:hypothetical protein